MTVLSDFVSQAVQHICVISHFIDAHVFIAEPIAEQKQESCVFKQSNTKLDVKSSE